ncbi:kynureninase [Alicyclobacillus fastidiosus]|uniref:Kynureninase n=1 Tax=Alicyclobacillus fastidiosus TaxID=392011 RepID=A0ABV5AEP2_9BACL|nr:kynureninase [Alicyclobacillus fastidiosus]WEH09768.1 kynureninase [Alicyclobacillus fastidiosus]
MAMSDTSRAYAEQLDKEDALSSFKQEFYVKEGTIYMDGNSLGLLSKRSEQSLLAVLDSWRTLGIDGWTEGEHPWFDYSEKLGAMLAPLVGASAEEVIVTGSTTTNLHQLVATFYRPEGARTKIVADELTFPSDIYVLQSQIRLHGLDPQEHLIQVKSRDGRMVNEDDIIAAMSDEVALVLLPSVLYRSGQLLDIQRLSAAARARNIPIGFDLCHSIGAVQHELSLWDVDFAVWCNYKYLNAGPGSVAGLFVNRRHFGRLPALAGWFSSRKDVQFDMDHQLTPAEHAGAYQIGTPHILSAAPLMGSLLMFAEAGIDKLRAKSLRMTQYMMDLMESELSGMGFVIGNPIEDHRRGGHVALIHEEAVRICKALKDNGVVPDFRAPDVIRLAPIPLYTSFQDVWDMVQRLRAIMLEKQYERYEKKRGVVA